MGFLTSVPNFRDIGGLSTAEGRRIRRDLVFRSAAFSAVGVEDRQALDARRIRWVCDLRAAGERESRPQGWPDPGGAEIWFSDHAATVGSIVDTVVAPGATSDQVRAAMIETYRTLPFSHREAYAEILHNAASGRLPMVVNCSAGKDRTGVAIAILLDLLGVSRQTILEEYLLTQSALEALAEFILSGPRGALLRTAGRSIWAPMIGVDAAYLQAAFEAIEQRHGDVAAYARESLGFGDLDALRDALLEAPPVDRKNERQASPNLP